MSELDRNRSGTPGGFHLGRANKKVMGVCSGIADYFGWDVNIVRIAWVVGTLLGVGSLIMVISSF